MNYKEILLLNKFNDQLITAIEGMGDNLTAEDGAEGCKDYMMTSVYEQDGEELKLVDSGQMLTTEYIKDLDTEEIVARLADYWGSNKQYIEVIKEN